MIGSLYRPGTSFLHRAGPGPKLLALAGVGTLLFLVPDLALSLGALGLALLLFALSGLGLRAAGRAVRAMLAILLLVGLTQALIAGWHAALLFTARLAALLLFAGLVTATTRVSAMTEAVERGLSFLKPLGVDPARVGLAVSLAIRFVPVLAAVAGEIREAQAARNLDRSVFAMAVPLVLRTLKMADEVAEAIDARS